MDMQYFTKNLYIILLPASITSRGIWELQEINKDENKKIKKAGGRSLKRNEKLETHEMRITNRDEEKKTNKFEQWEINCIEK